MSVRPPTRILVAEDDPDIGSLLEHYLKKAGFLPTLVTSGRDQTIAGWSLEAFSAHPLLGAQLQPEKDSLMVGKVDAGSPGWEVGLSPGDEIRGMWFNGDSADNPTYLRGGVNHLAGTKSKDVGDPPAAVLKLDEHQASREIVFYWYRPATKEILAGKIDFAEAAKKHSQCPSKVQGGDVGYFPRKFAVEENFARAAFALKPGEISDVIETDVGFHVIKVVDRKAGQTSTYDRLKEEVREVASEEMRQKLLAQQRRVSKVEIMLDGAPALKPPSPAMDRR